MLAVAGVKHAPRSYCKCESFCATAVELRDRLHVLDHVSLNDVNARETGDFIEDNEGLEAAVIDETAACRPAVGAVISGAY